MAKSYDSSLSTDKDWVRFLIGDTGSFLHMTDEEITGLLALQTAASPASRYFASSEAIMILYARWAAEGKGTVERQISKLRIRKSEGSSEARAVERRSDELKRRGAFLLTDAAAKAYSFRMV